MIVQSIVNIAKACNGKIVQMGDIPYVHGISTDSRTIEGNMLFIPLIGERFDGHGFLPEAKKKGACAALFQKDTAIDMDALDHMYLIEVENTLDALHAISKGYREQFSIPFVGITGSTGKTTTKDMISSVLGYKYKVLKNYGNLNNQIGLPITLFHLDPDHEIGILEMGMSSYGEIANLVRIVKPNIAVITNIGMSHIEHFGSRENIMKAKLEITTYLKERDVLLLNGDDEYLKILKEKKNHYRRIFFGLSQENDVYAKNIQPLGEMGFSFDAVVEGQEERFIIKQAGLHNVYNALAAIWIGKYYNMTSEEIQEGLHQFLPSKMRLEILERDGIKIINDAYNASPDSMKAAIAVLENIKGKRRIAVLGNMFEMGNFSEEGHRLVGNVVADSNVDVLITVGDMAKWIAEEAEEKGFRLANIFTVMKNKESIDLLKNMIQKGDIVLVKGSRGMRMEEIVKFLHERS